MKEKWNIPEIDLLPNTTCTQEELTGDWERSIESGSVTVNGLTNGQMKARMVKSHLTYHLLHKVKVSDEKYNQIAKYVAITSHQGGYNKPVFSYLTMALIDPTGTAKQMRVIPEETTHFVSLTATESGFTIHEMLDGFIDTNSLDRKHEDENKAKFSCSAYIDVNLLGDTPQVTLLAGDFSCKNEEVMERLGLEITSLLQRIINWIKEKIFGLTIPTVTPPTLQARGISLFQLRDPWTLEKIEMTQETTEYESKEEISNGK